MKISIPTYKQILPKTSLKKTIKSYYYASKPVDYAHPQPPKQSLIEKVKHFFKAIYYANTK